MTRTALGSACACMCALAAACGGASRVRGPFTPAAMMRDVGALAAPALDGRRAGTEGEHAADRYAAARLAELGLAPVVQPFPWRGDHSANLYAVIGGDRPGDAIVIGAHLDHLGRRRGALYPGADDDASGVATVLAVAAALREQPLARPVVIALFGAEEAGLAGSRYFVAHLPRPVRAMVNVDMVARPLQDRFWFRRAMALVGIDRDAVGLYGARRYPALRALADGAIGAQTVAAEDFPRVVGDEIERQTRGRGDNEAFADAGIPALFFGDGESADYHRPSDTVDKLDPDILARRAEGIARVVAALAAAPDAAFVEAQPSTAATGRTASRERFPGGWFLPVGFSTGISLHPRAGALLGGEASLVHLAQRRYAGLYADALHDGAGGDTRLSIGPEIGASLVGVDAGYVLDLAAGHARSGAAARVFVSAGVLAVSARAGYVDGAGWFGEVGLAVKLPLHLCCAP